MHKEVGFSCSSATLFNASFKIFNYQPSNAKSSVVLAYNDVSNSVTSTERFSHNNQDEKNY